MCSWSRSQVSVVGDEEQLRETGDRARLPAGSPPGLWGQGRRPVAEAASAPRPVSTSTFTGLSRELLALGRTGDRAGRAPLPTSPAPPREGMVAQEERATLMENRPGVGAPTGRLPTRSAQGSAHSSATR